VVQGRVERKGPAVHLTVVLIDSKRLRQIGSAELEGKIATWRRCRSKLFPK